MATLTPALPLPCLTGFCSLAQPLNCAGGAGRGCAGARRGRVSRWLPCFAVAIWFAFGQPPALPWPAAPPAVQPAGATYVQLHAVHLLHSTPSSWGSATAQSMRKHATLHLFPQAHGHGRVLWPEAGRLLLHRWVPLAVLLHARFGLRANTVVTLPAGPVERWGRAKQAPNALSHHTLTAPRIHGLLHSLPLQSTAGCRATAAATPARPSLWATSPAPR